MTSRSLIALLCCFSAQPLLAESADHEKLISTASYAMSMQTEATTKRCRVLNGSERVRSITERLKSQKAKLEDELGKEAVHEIFSLRGYYDGNLLLLETTNCRKSAKLKSEWEIWVVAFDDAVTKLSVLLEQR